MHESNPAAATMPAPSRDILTEILHDGMQRILAKRLTPRWPTGSIAMQKSWVTTVTARRFATAAT